MSCIKHKTTHPFGGKDAPLPKPKNDVVLGPIPSLPPYHYEAHHRLTTSITLPFMATAASWLRNRRFRYLFLLLCSPLLVCLFCTALPYLCVVDLWRKFARDFSDDERLRRCGGDEEKGLLHRYLEDQLLLVRSMYECGDDEEEEFRRGEDVENLGSSMNPLLG